MISVQEKDAETVQLNLEGTITGEDYKSIRPQLEKMFAEGGRKKFLFNCNKVKTFTIGSIIQDVKFDLQHFKYIGTTAVVSPKPLAETITNIADKLYPVKIEYFDELASASQWLKNQKV